MMKTFIYGVPHGFDFYEKDSKFNDYFKGFYISSRRGRRLLINRRDNGDTIYSYLRYGLKEVDRQPLHSFFGMSLVVGNYQFCPNFKVLLEWFDYLFNKMVNEHNIIKKNEDGIYHYVIHKFDENPSDVEWLKSNMPNILTKERQTKIVSYDSSFAEGKAGQVVSFNQPVSEYRLLEIFKKYRWISISSEITEKEEKPVIGTIELNYEELNGKLNEFNQQLLPIAVDISKGSCADLKQMLNEVQEINASLIKYLPSIDDQEEKEMFIGLESKYDSLKRSVSTLLSKLNTDPIPDLPPQPIPDTLYCFSCKQNKPLSHFRSPDATKCLECEEQERRKEYRTCINCGKEKPVKVFNQKDANICDDCAKTKPKPKGTYEKLGKVFMSKGFLGVLASIAIVVGVVFAAVNLPNGCSTTNNIGGGRVDTTKANVATTGNVVDTIELKRLVDSHDFKAVYDYMKDKRDTANYKNSLKKAVQQYLVSIVDEPLSSKEKVQESIAYFFVDNFEFLEFVNLEQEQQYWKKFVNDYYYLWELIKKKSISQNEKERGDNILKTYKELLPKTWNDSWANVKVNNPVPNPVPVITPGSISVKYTSFNYEAKNEKITSNRNIFVLPGSLVTISYPQGEIKLDKRKQMNKWTIKVEKEILVHCGNIGITITPKKNKVISFNE